MKSNPSNRARLSTSFKSALIDFLAYEIRSQHYKGIINEKQSCIYVQVDNNEVIISPHNEADTRILLHSRYAAENTSNPHIVVRASDTEIFILLFYFASQLDAQIWMDTGNISGLEHEMEY